MRTVIAVAAGIAALSGCGGRPAMTAMTITPQAAKQPFLDRDFGLLRDLSPLKDEIEAYALVTGHTHKPPAGGLTIYRTISEARHACAASPRAFCSSPVYRVRNVTLAPDPAWSTAASRRWMLAALQSLGTPVRIN